MKHITFLYSFIVMIYTVYCAVVLYTTYTVYLYKYYYHKNTFQYDFKATSPLDSSLSAFPSTVSFWLLFISLPYFCCQWRDEHAKKDTKK